jgi:hypothetical protein
MNLPKTYKLDLNVTDKDVEDYYNKSLKTKSIPKGSREVINASLKTYYPQGIRDALYNLRSDSGANVDYCKGLVIGLISALEYKGYTFKECCSIIYMNLPSGYRRECLPETVAELIVEG